MANIRTSNRSGFRTVRGVRRRETLWLAGVFAQTVMAAEGGTLISSFNAAALALRPFTVLRTRGELVITADQASSSERQWAAYGFAVVSDQAAAIGVSAIPTPVTDQGSDLWFVYQALINAYEFQTAASTTPIGKRYSFDSRAMRKVEDGQDVVEVAEMSLAGSAGSGLRLQSAFRMLIKLH